MIELMGRWGVSAVAIIVVIVAVAGCTTRTATDAVPGSTSRCACEVVPMGVVPDDAMAIAARARGLA